VSISTFFDTEFEEHGAVLLATRAALAEQFPRIVNLCVQALNNGHKIILFGNGGSAADAQHIATELTVRYTKNRRALAALSLATDTSALTAIGNDFSFDEIFSRQIEALGQPGDVALGISTSGQSPNVNLALRKAHEMGLVCTGWSGKSGGEMVDLCEVLLVVPSQTTARIQEMHILLGHLLCGAIEQKMGLV
jgi:D-sedoheptulose 7-phosphate isomerase